MILKSWLARHCQPHLLSLLILVCAIAGQGGDRTFAQVIADPTLGTQVTPNSDGTTLEITGGTTVGNTNLFHSFRNFSIKSDEVVDFQNASNINNILVRVTGRNPSDIQGTLQAQGQANLFLINPNGIIFGRGAELDIGGSFIGTTASKLQFPGGGEFSMTSPVNPLNPVLKVNPSALLFNQIAASTISIQKAYLGVEPGQSLLLVGGDVNLERGRLRATSGRIEIGGLKGEGTVGLNLDSNNFRLSFSQNVERADVSLSDAATVSASGGNGAIQVQGRRVRLTDDSSIGLTALTSQPGGTLVVNASELVELRGGSSLSTVTQYTGDAGNLRIETKQLIVQDGSQISASTFNRGRGGTLSVTADSIQLVGVSPQGKPSGLFNVTETESTGDAGNIAIKTGRLIVQDGAQISASTLSRGQGGTLSITADSIQLVGISPQGKPSGLFNVTESTGDAGNIAIKTGRLIVQDGAQISASTRNGGQGGTLSVTADSIQLGGTSSQGIPSGLFVRSIAAGDAGNLEIEAEQLTVQDGARIAASTSKESTGQGGSIIIKAEELDVLNNGAINVASEGTEQAGDLEITADSIKLDNQGKLIGQANSGNGGNIKLNLRKLLLLRHNSEISTSSGTQRAGGNGGKITINVPSGFIIAVPSENSDITANAYTGKGGSVRINANGIYGTQFREKENPQTSDITASSDFGLNGNVELNTPDIDPNSGLIELPTTPVDTKVAQGCYSPNYAQSGFLITGRGGLPANPKDILTPDATEIDWVSLKSSHNRSLPPVTNKPTIPTPKRIVEATGAILNANGQVVLTANPPTANFHSPRNIATACRNN